MLSAPTVVKENHTCSQDRQIACELRADHGITLCGSDFPTEKRSTTLIDFCKGNDGCVPPPFLEVFASPVISSRFPYEIARKMAFSR